MYNQNTDDAGKVNNMMVVPSDDPPCLRMVKVMGVDKEELVVRIPRILCSKTLPPIERPL
jgi:hypothetical protein